VPNISADPIGEAGGLNIYGYAGNDPIITLDPFGLQDVCVKDPVMTPSHKSGRVSPAALASLYKTISAANEMKGSNGDLLFDIYLFGTSTMNDAYDSVKISDLTLINAHGNVHEGLAIVFLGDGFTYSSGLRNVARAHAHSVKFASCGNDSDGHPSLTEEGKARTYAIAYGAAYFQRIIKDLMKNPPKLGRPYIVRIIQGPL
jgi:hypothetical protein